MTKDQDFKHLVRARAAETGESYAAARRQLRPDHVVHGALGEAAITSEFERTGIVRLAGVFSDEAATAMQEAVWAGWADAFGVSRSDRSTWVGVPRWKTVREAKRDPSFRLILGDQLTKVADLLLGPGWSVPNGFGNLLASLPDAPSWHLPGKDGLWHSDFGYCTPMQPLAGLRVFAVFGSVPPGGGGTLLVAGSHRMVERFVTTSAGLGSTKAKEARVACHRSNPWLEELTLGDGYQPGRVDAFMAAATDIDGIEAQVVEACGEPGDVFVCHPWTIHCRPPNASSEPRFLRSPTLAHRQGHPPTSA